MPERTVSCAHCGASFTAKRSDAVCCSHRCTMRLKKGTSHRRQCIGCPTDITQRMGNAKYCTTCAAERAEVYEATQKAKAAVRAECIGCGQPFLEPSSNKYCGQRCAGKTSRAKQLAVEIQKTCTTCREEFLTLDNRRNECGTACRQWAAKYPGILRMLERECRHCTQPFRGATAAQHYCTPRCTASAGKIQRRGRMEAAYIEPVSKGAIARRDKWICQLCRDKVDKTLEWPHPMSWSLDHVVPVSKGGEHSNANCQLTHLVCNVSKGSRLKEPQQLALIG